MPSPGLALLLQSGLREALERRTRSHLYDRARALGVDGRSTMDKDALADAVARELQRIVDDAPFAFAG